MQHNLWRAQDDRSIAERCLASGAEEPQAEAVERDENAQDENREGGRRVRRRPDEPAAFDGEAAPAEKPVAAPQEPAERPAEQVRISRTKWTYLHNHVLACIKSAEDGQVEGAQRIESSAQTFMGVPQHDIIKWHIKQELEKCAPAVPFSVFVCVCDDNSPVH